MQLQPNLVLKWDNAPTNYSVFIYRSEVRLRFEFAVGTCQLILS